MSQHVIHEYCHCAQDALDWLKTLIGSEIDGKTVDDIAHFVVVKNGVHATDTAKCFLVIAVVET